MTGDPLKPLRRNIIFCKIGTSSMWKGRIQQLDWSQDWVLLEEFEEWEEFVGMGSPECRAGDRTYLIIWENGLQPCWCSWDCSGAFKQSILYSATRHRL